MAGNPLFRNSPDPRASRLAGQVRKLAEMGLKPTSDCIVSNQIVRKGQMKQRFQVVDLDGCISDDRHRRNLIDMSLIGQRRFDRYHSACVQDEAANLHEIDPDLPIIVLTGRMNRVRGQTEWWLRNKASCTVEPSLIIMRNDHDTTPSLELKRVMMSWLFDPNYYGLIPEQIATAIDDRASIVEMYRRDFGLNSRIVRIGEEHEHA